jgi:hypothetical protein
VDYELRDIRKGKIAASKTSPRGNERKDRNEETYVLRKGAAGGGLCPKERRSCVEGAAWRVESSPLFIVGRGEKDKQDNAERGSSAMGCDIVNCTFNTTVTVNCGTVTVGARLN